MTDYAENNAGEVRMLQQQVPGNLWSLHLHTNSSIPASGKHQQHLPFICTSTALSGFVWSESFPAQPLSVPTCKSDRGGSS